LRARNATTNARELAHDGGAEDDGHVPKREDEERRGAHLRGVRPRDREYRRGANVIVVSMGLVFRNEKPQEMHTEVI
jgi:hypothetical protein